MRGVKLLLSRKLRLRPERTGVHRLADAGSKAAIISQATLAPKSKLLDPDSLLECIGLPMRGVKLLLSRKLRLRQKQAFGLRFP
jgi:hypothetical protein